MAFSLFALVKLHMILARIRVPWPWRSRLRTSPTLKHPCIAQDFDDGVQQNTDTETRQDTDPRLGSESLAFIEG